jgi:hypothetical protein
MVSTRHKVRAVNGQSEMLSEVAWDAANDRFVYVS